MSVAPRSASVAPVIAETATGVFWSDSDRRRAVTTMSAIPPDAVRAACDACSGPAALPCQAWAGAVEAKAPRKAPRISKALKCGRQARFEAPDIQLSPSCAHLLRAR